MAAKYSIPELLEQEKYCVMVPCVYDCASARAAELAGYKAILLSGGEVGEILGCLKEDEMSEDELLFMASHICAYSPLPLIIDCGCFSTNPTSVHRWARKFADAGAMALLLEDGDCPDGETYLAMVRAAVHACRDTKCIVIGRSNRRLVKPEDYDYVVDLMNASIDLGAYMTMACGLNSMEKARIIGERVKGPKFYPDQNAKNGKVEVVNEEIYELGYSMISFHYMLKAAMDGMIDDGIRNLEAGNNLPTIQRESYNGYHGCSATPFFDYQGKFDAQAEYTGVRRIFHIPGEQND